MAPFFIILFYFFFSLLQVGKTFTGQKSPGKATKSPSTPISTITWSFPPRSKVSCAPPDITVGHNGINKETTGLLTPDTSSRETATLNDGSAASTAAVSAAATAMASGLGGDLCCPSFGIRPPRLVTSTNGDPSSVTCSLL